MYGEKTEEAEELRLDLLDVKEMYKMQIEDLLRKQKSWFYKLVTSSSHVFHESTIFSRNDRYVSFLEGCIVSFSVMYHVMINSYISIYLVQKQNKENFVKKIRRFRIREKHVMSLTFEQDCIWSC